jgi:cardiolipin synthase
MTEQPTEHRHHGQADDPLDTVFTWPNLITLLRFLLIPLFLYFLLSGYPPLYAFVTFVIAASTDWVDGRLARRTNQVSKVGQLLDPFIDRFLLLSGVLGVWLLGRLPLWIVIILIARDCILFFGALYLKEHCDGARVPVFFLGKCTTASLLIGFASLLINWPLVEGLHWFEVAWLPAFGWGLFPFGIWFVYVGLVLSVSTGVVYFIRGVRVYNEFQAGKRASERG